MTDKRTDAINSLEERQARAAARDAARIGGHAGDEGLDPAQRPLIEAGEGVAEGFELAEADLIEAATLGGPEGKAIDDRFAPELESDRATVVYAEADAEEPAGGTGGDR
jgi:hypothetical protein